MDFALVESLISNNKFLEAEDILNKNYENTDIWHFLYSKVMLSKQWFDSALHHLNIALAINPDNSIYKDDLLMLIRRNRVYSNDYYQSGYRRHRSGCGCCCCDDCCCDCNFSCCDLICLDSCCECMGGDLIDCI